MQSFRLHFGIYNFTFVPKSFSLNQHLTASFLNSISVAIKREDLIHPFVPEINLESWSIICSKLKRKNENAAYFWGAFSNHIAAVAYAGKENGFKTIGIIRMKLQDKITENPTLLFAQNCGMQFEFISREAYRSKKRNVF
jgi:1-aminocyclopropane-1-carboxylate deaminase